MLGWLMIAASVVAMYRITDMEGKNGMLWGLATFGICLACAMFIPIPLINIGIGFAASFLAYFIYKVAYNE